MKKYSLSIILSLAILFSLTRLVWGWTNPTANPPEGSGSYVGPQWTTSGSNIYYNTGNVGIGAASPGQKLDVAGIANVQNYLNTSYFTATSTTATSTISTGGFTVGTTQFIVQQNSGNVGIGTASPDANYKITTSGGGIKAENSDASNPAGYFNNANATGIALQSTGTTTLATTGGKVGIGTTEPVGTLDVNGTLYANNFTGMITFFVGANCPTGWVLADGATVSSSGVSAKLYTYVGTTYGTAGTLPDMTTAGRFIRSTGGNADALGTQQADAFQGHIHKMNYDDNGTNGAAGSFTSGTQIDGEHQAYMGTGMYENGSQGTPRTASETRSINYAMTPCIKY